MTWRAAYILSQSAGVISFTAMAIYLLVFVGTTGASAAGWVLCFLAVLASLATSLRVEAWENEGKA